MIQDNSKQIIKFIDNIEVFWRENSPRLARYYLQIE